MILSYLCDKDSLVAAFLRECFNVFLFEIGLSVNWLLFSGLDPTFLIDIDKMGFYFGWKSPKLAFFTLILAWGKVFTIISDFYVMFLSIGIILVKFEDQIASKRRNISTIARDCLIFPLLCYTLWIGKVEKVQHRD